MGNFVDEEPTCFELSSKNKECMQDMIKTYQSIINNDVWDLVPRPKDKSIVSSKYIFKTKNSADGGIEKFKAIFVAQGFS